MAYAKHIIQRQLIELEIPEELDRTAIQNQVTRIYREEIVPLIDALLSQNSGSSTLVIDRLEINIGPVTADKLEQVLADKVKAALQEKLEYIKTPPIPAPSALPAATRQAVSGQESHSDAALLIYFLQTGLFPWWAQETTYGYLVKAFSAAFVHNYLGFKTSFAALLQQGEVAKRLIYTFSDTVLMQAAGYYGSPQILTTVHRQKEQLLQAFTGRLTMEELREHWWLSIYQIITGTNLLSEEQLLEKAGSLFVYTAARTSRWTLLIQFLQSDQAAGIMGKMVRFMSATVAGTGTDWQQTRLREKQEQGNDEGKVFQDTSARENTGRPETAAEAKPFSNFHLVTDNISAYLPEEKLETTKFSAAQRDERAQPEKSEAGVLEPGSLQSQKNNEDAGAEAGEELKNDEYTSDDAEDVHDAMSTNLNGVRTYKQQTGTQEEQKPENDAGKVFQDKAARENPSLPEKSMKADPFPDRRLLRDHRNTHLPEEKPETTAFSVDQRDEKAQPERGKADVLEPGSKQSQKNNEDAVAQTGEELKNSEPNSEYAAKNVVLKAKADEPISESLNYKGGPGLAQQQDKSEMDQPVFTDSAEHISSVHLGIDKNTAAINRPVWKPRPQLFNDIDKIYIQNAGLVLLWPFLHRFFQYADLADERTFISERKPERACLLLQYLVTGSTEDMFEAQLPLNKLLCGIPLLKPVNTQWLISDEEKETAENFLLAVIQQGGDGWKNLSAAGLRQAYLYRNGIISGRDGNWLLQVERKPYDVLTDRLPWPMQVAKLPWMERLVFVEW